MKWVSQDIEMFLKEKQYVDTAVLPLLPVSFGDDIKQSVAMTEFISLLSVQLERQFRGRLIMLPGYAYLKSAGEESLLSGLGEWEAELKAQGFKHIFLLTSDSMWKSLENRLEGGLIWLPSLPLEHMDENYRNSILDEQVKQLLNLFVQKWQNGE
ncbi:YpiF family protein [Cytobacillus oceanisediminis]|uniref:YpiF family protein n=1 Tax=Cytobacillus oceanisediminis TaxID=665099 RepID=UPI002494724E|nr:YpiF family protein [Cytobacillus oceanisediminis]